MDLALTSPLNVSSACRATVPSVMDTVRRFPSTVFLTGSPRSLESSRRLRWSEKSADLVMRKSSLCSPCCALVLKERYAGAGIQGTGRVQMEDSFTIEVDSTGKDPAFFGVYDGHGGNAVSEMLQKSVWPIYKRKLSGPDVVRATRETYLELDQLALAAPKGLFGALRERGLGGSKCGATAATAVLFSKPDGSKELVTANVGDARVILVRGGQAIQLTVDHKPDVKEERERIEAKNPTPKKPLVVNVGGTWRVGGLLALSRAFGDAYLKDWSDNQINGARGGYGLTAEPNISVETLTPEDQMIILGTDGLWELGNQEVVDICLAAGESTSPEEILKELFKVAVERGVTDDLAGIIIRL
ncbi:probable protein phosphatase 2C 45 isoform X2 [Physcomitrium patens]|uniref:protein-serine/threonine phosphatase n=1 Tax=Physcomitrium patens TaxID=3218 RepID=A9SWS6_PHYPA|nr:probable protein phosphatase 2C 45 isoform X2 [Physcomitrium patens]PNR50495.1 hypothetical protein PHYPA_009681 [Physcomitrium patens]|eukprot:XP_024380638.1 probable protein phosphatase 2C 45 isoform X2 [Physcomitrella patens]